MHQITELRTLLPLEQAQENIMLNHYLVYDDSVVEESVGAVETPQGPPFTESSHVERLEHGVEQSRTEYETED